MAEGPASGWVFKPSRDWGRDARGYHLEYDQQLREYTKPRESDSKTPKILIMGHEATGDDPVAPQIHEWCSLFHDNGYDFKVGYAKSFVPAHNKAGRDKVMHWSYVEGVKRGKPKVHIVYGHEDGGKGWTNGDSWVYGRGKMLLKQIQEEIER